MRQALRTIAALAAVALLILGWQNRWRLWGIPYFDFDSYSNDRIAQTRYVFAQTPGEPIKVAVVWATDDGDDPNPLCEGARVALGQLRQGAEAAGLRGGNLVVAGAARELEIDCVRASNVGEEVEVARRISRDPTYTAVVGHSTNDSAKLASVSYEATSIPFVAVNTTDTKLTNHGFGYVFRTLPDDHVVTTRLMQQLRAVVPAAEPAGGAGGPAAKRGVGIFYAQSAYAFSSIKAVTAALGDFHYRTLFEKSYDAGLVLPPDYGRVRAPETGGKLTDRYSGGTLTPPEAVPDQEAYESRSFFFSPDFPKKWQQKMKNLRDKVNNVRDNAVSPRADSGHEADLRALLLIDDVPERAGVVLNQIRAAGLNKPVIGGPGLDSIDLLASIYRLRGAGQTIPSEMPVLRYIPEAGPGGDARATYCLSMPFALGRADAQSYRPAEAAGADGAPDDDPCGCEHAGAASDLTPAVIRDRAARQPDPGADTIPPVRVIEDNLTYIASVFDAGLPSACVQGFGRRFRAHDQRNGAPGLIEAQGYEAIWLLAQALARADSAAPVDIVSALKTRGPYRGVRGPVCFNARGDICGKEIFVKVLEY